MGKEHISAVWKKYSDVVVERAEGAYIFAADGRRYLDFTSGIGVTNTGHCHPKVVAAARDQVGKLIHGEANLVYHKPMLDLTDELLAVVPPGFDTFFFGNSGAEAVEGALKMARQVSSRPAVIAFQGAFHGRTMGALSLTTSKAMYRAHYSPLLAGVYHTPYPYCYRCPLAGTLAAPSAVEPPHAPAGCGLKWCLGQLEYLLATQVVPADVAAIIFEPVLGEGGYVAPPVEFARALRRLCDEHGIFLIMDEVQAGIGRTGRFFAHEHYGIRPDIITMAKGLASGLPLSCIAAPRAIMGRWAPGSHGTTFGGNAVSCAAAVATLRAIRDEGMVANAAQMGSALLDGLLGLKARDAGIGDIRGLGLMLAAEFVAADGSPDAARSHEILHECSERGLLLLACGVYDNAIRFVPPLIVSREQVQEALAIFAAALQAVPRS